MVDHWSPAECAVSECDLETSTVRPEPTRAVESRKKKEPFSSNCSYFSPISSTARYDLRYTN